MTLIHENIRLFWKLFVSSNKESSHKEFFLFPTYVPVVLIKSKLQIHPANPTNPDILKFIAQSSKFL